MAKQSANVTDRAGQICRALRHAIIEQALEAAYLGHAQPAQ
jgi:hypothetical protein